jgi:hypothetical protein
MIIELAVSVAVRVPQEKLPLGHKGSVFHTFPSGYKVNYSSERPSTSHTIHRFVGHSPKYGPLNYMTVTLNHETPNWL